MENELHWYAAYTKSRHEKVVKERLEQKGFETFLPIIVRKNQWKDRVKDVETPLIKSYIFVHVESKDLLYIMQTHGVVNIVRIGVKYTIVPDYQIDALKKALEERMNLTPESHFAKGEKVKVLSGPLMGKIGLIQEISGHTKLILKVDAINFAFSTPVNPENVEKIQ